MANTISNTDEMIDSRDVIARIEELEGERQALADEVEETNVPDEEQQDAHEAAVAVLEEWDGSDDAEELAALKALASEAEGYGDWQHGETLIHEDHFEKYAKQFAEDLHGDWIRDAEWPLNHIDWEAAADELKQDYMEVDFDGETYLMRA